MNVGHRRLRDWKEIAAFFGRDERTVRRWERARALPVHRPSRAALPEISSLPMRTSWSSGWRSGGEAASPGRKAEGDCAEPRRNRPIPWRRGTSRRATLATPSPAWRSRRSLLAYRRLHRRPGRGHRRRDGLCQAGLADQNCLQAGARVQNLYLDAVYSLGTRQASGLTQAMQLLTEAATLDPNYARRLCEARRGVQYDQPVHADAGRRGLSRALAAANRAISLDPGNAEAHAALAFTTFYWSKDFSRSRLLFEQAVALDPDVAQTHHWYALTRMVTGETDLPLREIGLAQELSPNRAPSWRTRG